jgi:hypothetical protein
MPGPLTKGSPHWGCEPDPLKESRTGFFYNPIQPGSSSKARCRSLLSLFSCQALRVRISLSDRSYWSALLFKPILLVWLFLFFCVMGPKAFWHVLFAWVVFTTSCCALRFGSLRPIPLHWYLKGVCIYFLAFYSFDTVPLIFIFSGAPIEKIIPVTSLIFVLMKRLLKNLPLFLF